MAETRHTGPARPKGPRAGVTVGVGDACRGSGRRPGRRAGGARTHRSSRRARRRRARRPRALRTTSRCARRRRTSAATRSRSGAAARSSPVQAVAEPVVEVGSSFRLLVGGGFAERSGEVPAGAVQQRLHRSAGDGERRGDLRDVQVQVVAQDRDLALAPGERREGALDVDAVARGLGRRCRRRARSAGAWPPRAGGGAGSSPGSAPTRVTQAGTESIASPRSERSHARARASATASSAARRLPATSATAATTRG